MTQSIILLFVILLLWVQASAYVDDQIFFFFQKKACSEVVWTIPIEQLADGYSFDEILIRSSVTDLAQIPLLHDNYLFPTSLRKASRHMKPAKVTVSHSEIFRTEITWKTVKHILNNG